MFQNFHKRMNSPEAPAVYFPVFMSIVLPIVSIYTQYSTVQEYIRETTKKFFLETFIYNILIVNKTYFTLRVSL